MSRPPLRDQLSVVLLTHNCAHRLAPILDQLSRLPLRIVAVDNGSSDETAELLAQRPAIDLVVLPTNIGACARNVGVERARTPYVACCDDDEWYELEGLSAAVDMLEAHPSLAVINARIMVGEEQRLDPMSTEMAASPLVDDPDIPGAVLLGFMAGAAVVRRAAYLEVGGYDPRFFIGGEEETLGYKLAGAGWRMRYLPDVVVQHRPSRASVHRLRPYGLRNTIWNAWLRRPWRSALRWTLFTLVERPKNRAWLSGLVRAVAGLPWVLRERDVVPDDVDANLRILDQRRFAEWRSRRG